MARVILMRHGDATLAAPSDRSRALSAHGRQDARRMGAWLREQGWIPDVAVVSPALRARQTAQEALAGMESPAPLEVREGLYSGNVADYLEAASASPCTLVVGHNPTIEAAVQALTGAEVHVATAMVACIEDGHLVMMMRPSGLP